jgi:phage shock protein PspC (stress-responsive transcriptional regulator)
MNKTVNINLGGLFFHIDEDAYQKLTRYFEAIKKSISSGAEQKEIMNDIEMRVSELLSEKQKSDKHVIGLLEIDDIIAVMGQPEDYRIEGEATTEIPNYNYNSSNIKLKKLYRDKDNGMIGGVLAGLGHYFGIDKVWLRIASLILLFAWGTGVVAYIILWIAMPEAVTTSEKLEMTGEPVTISNIEKKVREEFEQVSNKINGFNSKKVGTNFENILFSIGHFISKCIGAFFIVTAFSVIVSMFVATLTLGNLTNFQLPFSDYLKEGILFDFPFWLISILLFFAISIPFFFLLLLGLKIIRETTKSIGSVAKYSLLGIWIFSLVFLTTIIVKELTNFSENGVVVERSNVNIMPKDTLLIKFASNDNFAQEFDEDEDTYKITIDDNNKPIVYSNNIDFEIHKTNEKVAYIQITKHARGASVKEARKNAKNIEYRYKIVGNQLILNSYLITSIKDKFRGQEIEIDLYLPKGTVFKADENLQQFDSSDNDFFNLHYSSDSYIYKVKEDKVRCLNCPDDEDEYDDLENADMDTDSINITIEGNNLDKTTKSGSLKINKDGIIIKTK